MKFKDTFFYHLQFLTLHYVRCCLLLFLFFKKKILSFCAQINSAFTKLMCTLNLCHGNSKCNSMFNSVLMKCDTIRSNQLKSNQISSSALIDLNASFCYRALILLQNMKNASLNTKSDANLHQLLQHCANGVSSNRKKAIILHSLLIMKHDRKELFKTFFFLLRRGRH